MALPKWEDTQPVSSVKWEETVPVMQGTEDSLNLLRGGIEPGVETRYPSARPTGEGLTGGQLLQGARQVVGAAAPAAGMLLAGGLAAPLVAPMSALAGLAATTGFAAAGAGAGSIAGQAIAGDDISLEKAGEEALSGAKYASIFGGAGIMGSAALKYVANSPRILDKVAGVLSALTKGEFKKSSLLEAWDRAGVPGAMKAIETATEQVKFAPRGAGKLSMDNVTTTTKMGGEKLLSVQTGIANIRSEAGAAVGRADSALVKAAREAGDDVINLSPIKAEIDEVIQFVNTNPLLSGAINTKRLEGISKKLAKNPNMSVEDAIKTKRVMQNTFEDFSNKGVMSVSEVDMVNQAMSGARVKVKEAIQEKARKLGVKEFEETYRTFGAFADEYDQLLKPLFGSKEGGKFAEDRFIKLANEVSQRGNVLEHVKNSAQKLLPGKVSEPVAKDISELTDLMLLRTIYQDIGSSPSSGGMGLFREFVVSPAAKRATKEFNIADIAKPLPAPTPSPTAAITKAAADTGIAVLQNKITGEK